LIESILLSTLANSAPFYLKYMAFQKIRTGTSAQIIFYLFFY
jgi:hypothetical protein